MSKNEVLLRREQIDTAIRTREPGLFAKSFVPWLEAMAYMRVAPNLTKIGLDPGPIPKFTTVDLREQTVRYDADDTVMAFCIAAGLAGDRKGFRGLHNILTHDLGVIYPGSTALTHCNQIIDPVETLDDAVGQVLKAMLEGESLDAPKLWNSALRILQRLRSSNFSTLLAALLAAWLRERWAAVIADPDGFGLKNRERVLPALQAALADPRDDQAFAAAVMHAAFDGIEPPLEPEFQTQLAKIAQRA